MIRHLNDQLNENAARAEERLAQVAGEKSEQAESLQLLKKAFDDKARQMEDLRRIWEEKEQQLAANLRLSEERAQNLDSFQRLFREKEEEVAAIQRWSEVKEQQVAANQKLLEEKEQQLNAIQRLLKEKEEEVADMHRLFKGKDEEIEAMKRLSEEKSEFQRGLFEEEKSLLVYQQREELFRLTSQFDTERTALARELEQMHMAAAEREALLGNQIEEMEREKSALTEKLQRKRNQMEGLIKSQQSLQDLMPKVELSEKVRKLAPLYFIFNYL